jgi:hypothetical protein
VAAVNHYVYVLSERYEYEEDECVLAVFSTLTGAYLSVPDVQWDEDISLLGDYWHGTGYRDGRVCFYTVLEYPLDPDDLELS